MNHPYIPISCAVHDELLAYATLRQECELSVVSAGGVRESVRGIIADVYRHGGAESLRLEDGGTYRLDMIRTLDGRPVPPA